jgi:two-component system chemotaxis response regulator CheB
VTRKPTRDARTTTIPRGARPRPASIEPTPARARAPVDTRLVVLGASTGGPPAVAAALRTLEPAAAPPVVIVQHMAPGFIEGFAQWLDRQIGPRVRLAVDGERMSAGTVYVAPDEHHLEVTPTGRLMVYDGPALRYHKPSVDVLFRSAGAHFGKDCIGVLLTGMGDDGARGFAHMREQGAFTMAQDRESSVVWGMPGSAAARGAVCWSGDCAAIAELLRGVRLKRPFHSGEGSS